MREHALGRRDWRQYKVFKSAELPFRRNHLRMAANVRFRSACPSHFKRDFQASAGTSSLGYLWRLSIRNLVVWVIRHFLVKQTANCKTSIISKGFFRMISRSVNPSFLSTNSQAKSG